MITPEKDFEAWISKYHSELAKEDSEYIDLKEAFLAGAESNKDYVANSLNLNVAAFNRALAKDILKLKDPKKIVEKLKEYAQG